MMRLRVADANTGTDFLDVLLNEDGLIQFNTFVQGEFTGFVELAPKDAADLQSFLSRVLARATPGLTGYEEGP